MQVATKWGRTDYSVPKKRLTSFLEARLANTGMYSGTSLYLTWLEIIRVAFDI